MRSVFKSEDDFNQFLDNEYFDELSTYYNSYYNRIRKAITSKIVFGVILGIFFLIIANVVELNKYVNVFFWLIDFFVIFFIAVGTFFSIYSEIKNDMFELNDEIIKDIVSFISERDKTDIDYSPNKMISKESLNEVGLFNLDVVKYSGKNYLNVPYYKNTMVFSDIYTYVCDFAEKKEEIYKNGKKYIRTTKKEKKKFIFDGVYIGATMNKKSKNQVYLIPNNISDRLIQSKIKNYINYRGYDITLENAEFMKKYKVFCDDETQARYILSMSLMERINKVDELFKGKKYIVFKEGKRFSMCIEGFSIENIKRNTLPVFQNKDRERKVLLKMFNSFNNLFKIYHILDLENSLYTKYNVEDFIKDISIQNNASISKEEAQKMATISFKNK